MLYQVFPVHLTELVKKWRLLDHEPKGVQRLAPLMGDVADHLPQCRLAALLCQKLLLPAQFLQGADLFRGLATQLVHGEGELPLGKIALRLAPLQ